ncbi:MAG: hypothetical protein CL823_07845 [Crocinitomicaceae bacterium]|nr:hypothetical protein [Crocinitomicaceae bacterium]|tara:strand:+ start:4120 stop:4857 length:738 start_codon:yes stop_codon:yes gene_type:complete
MDNNQPPRIFKGTEQFSSNSGSSSVLSKNFVANVFSWMVVGLIVTAFAAWYGAHSEIYAAIFGPEGNSILRWGLMLAPFAFIIIMNAGLERFSAITLTILFLAFAATMGLSLSSILYLYSKVVITKVFLITSGTFTVMSIAGYTTSKDLTKMGSLLFMALIGLIIASIANMFFYKGILDVIISIAGVLIFTGLIAYDTQKIKNIGASIDGESSTAAKMAILCATSIYLDFVNLFLFLLRFFGSRD